MEPENIIQNIIKNKSNLAYYTLLKWKDDNVYNICDMCNINELNLYNPSNIYQNKYVGFHTWHVLKLRKEYNIFQKELSELKYKFLKKFIFLFMIQNKYLCYDIINYILEYY